MAGRLLVAGPPLRKGVVCLACPTKAVLPGFLRRQQGSRQCFARVGLFTPGASRTRQPLQRRGGEP
eukprot:6237518-Lingulodinium_polyedra.AAC.1